MADQNDIPAADPAVETFDFGKKKKKKSSKLAVSETPVDATPTESAVAETGVETPAAGDAPAEGPVTSGGVESFSFGEKKKKKKKKKDLADFEAQLKEDGADVAGSAFGSTAGSTEDLSGLAAGDKGDEKTEDSWLSSNRDYTYEELLHRIFKTLRQNHPELAGEKKRYTIPPPQVLRESAKKSVFVNIVDICKKMRRQPDHVIQYFFAELGTTGSIDGSQRLIIKGKFQQKQIENVLKKYFVEYVTCKTCKSADTVLTKESRLYFLQCNACGSTRTVSAIKTGFVAQTGKRAAARAAAGM